MPRTINDIPDAGPQMPPAGRHLCKVLGHEKGRSSKKQTPQLELTLTNGECVFTDQLYVTGGAIRRLAMVAKRVCDSPEDFELPEDDGEAANAIASFIAETIDGKKCVVIVEENPEEFIAESGPDLGKKIQVMRRRVAFAGYERHEDQDEPETQQEQPIDTTVGDGDLPF